MRSNLVFFLVRLSPIGGQRSVGNQQKVKAARIARLGSHWKQTRAPLTLGALDAAPRTIQQPPMQWFDVSHPFQRYMIGPQTAGCMVNGVVEYSDILRREADKLQSLPVDLGPGEEAFQ